MIQIYTSYDFLTAPLRVYDFLLNPANEALVGTRLAYFPRGGPIPRVPRVPRHEEGLGVSAANSMPSWKQRSLTYIRNSNFKIWIHNSLCLRFSEITFGNNRFSAATSAASESLGKVFTLEVK